MFDILKGKKTKVYEESPAGKEFRLMVQLSEEPHILKPLKFIQNGSVDETNQRTGRFTQFKERQVIVSELASEGDLFDIIQANDPLMATDKKLLKKVFAEICYGVRAPTPTAGPTWT